MHGRQVAEEIELAGGKVALDPAGIAGGVIEVPPDEGNWATGIAQVARVSIGTEL